MTTVIHINHKSIADYKVLGPWCEANGINPLWVPLDNDIYVLKSGISLDMYEHDGDEIAHDITGDVIRRPHFYPCTPTPVPTLLYTLVEELP